MRPLDRIVQWIEQNKPRLAGKVCLDLGCGEGELAERLAVDLQAGKFRIFSRVDSLDLVSVKPHITVADIAALPHQDESVGCVVFCLSLMGTNYWRFVAEGLRVLAVGGVMVIAEVSSRMVDAVGFAKVIREAGTTEVLREDLGGYFNLFVFEKSRPFRGLQARGREGALKGCVYKKR